MFVVKIHMQESESFGVTELPLEVVEQRPGQQPPDWRPKLSASNPASSEPVAAGFAESCDLRRQHHGICNMK